MVFCCPVSVLVRVMEAFGTAAPDGSVTVPTMVPSCAAPRVTAIPRKTRRTARNFRLRLPRVAAILPAYAGESAFIAILQASFEGGCAISRTPMAMSLYRHCTVHVKKKTRSKSNLYRFSLLKPNYENRDFPRCY